MYTTVEWDWTNVGLCVSDGTDRATVCTLSSEAVFVPALISIITCFVFFNLGIKFTA